MTFYDVLDQVVALLQRQGRVSYRALKREFALDNDYVEDLKEELIGAKQLATDEDGRFLVWTGAQEPVVAPSSFSPPQSLAPPTALPPSEAERRQLTVMFCDVVGSTALSEQLDPEDLREVVRAYHQTCATVIQRYEGHTAQHLGDGLLVYFGYPAAHEDDAHRAVRAALGIVKAMQHLSVPTVALPYPLQVRIGVHTGLVVIGEIGGSEKHEVLALGETPNLAARLQGLAAPDTVVMSSATYRLSEGFFTCRSLGLSLVKGISAPIDVYQVLEESGLQSRFEVAVGAGLTPLVGRAEELALLQQRWEQAKAGTGQVVLLSGEPGIGKSRLVQTLKEEVSAEGAIRLEFRCSPYHQNSAFSPILDHLQRFLQFAPHDSPQDKLAKLAQRLAAYRFPQVDTLPLMAALLSLPHPEGSAPLTLSPQKQKQKTQDALVTWLVEEAEHAAVYCVWEDVHWIDPSTLDVLTLLLAQAPTSRLLTVLTFRPEFTPPWRPHSYITQLTLTRLGRVQVEALVERVTGGKPLPAEVVQQIVTKTDGVPLFVEELTKMVVESGLVAAVGDHYELSAQLPPLAIPSTLQDSLMARLDRLAPVRKVAQLGATLGREFSYELLQAVAAVDEDALQKGLRQLVEAELVYQRGVPPRATYIFKHALIQDAAYHSLLKSTRQQYHQQIAHMLEARFPEIKEQQPELVAHHYTEAGLIEQALPYWRQAGERATRRSAYVEAIHHLTRGLEVLQALADTPERATQELTLQLTLREALVTVKGYASPEVQHTALRAQTLCQQLGDTPQHVEVLLWVCAVHYALAEHHRAREVAEQCLSLAHRVPDAPHVSVHNHLGMTLYSRGEFPLAYDALKQALLLYDPPKHSPFAFPTPQDFRMACLSYAAWVLWYLGYPEQALQSSQEAVTWAVGLSHPFSLAYAWVCAAAFHTLRREKNLTCERAEAALTLATEQGFPVWAAYGTILRGWALAVQGQGEAGRAQLHRGMAACRIMGIEFFRSQCLAWLAEAYEKEGQIEEGLQVLAEALAVVEKTGERFYEAELYRLKGELLLAQQNNIPRNKNQQ